MSTVVMHYFVESGRWLDQATSACGWEAGGLGKRLVAARPILQEYDASTVVELGRHPAEFGKLAARHNLVEIAEACPKEADVGTRRSA